MLCLSEGLEKFFYKRPVVNIFSSVAPTQLQLQSESSGRQYINNKHGFVPINTFV